MVKGARRRKSQAGRLAYGALATAIILAPVTGGSSNIIMLPVLSALIGIAYCASLFATRNSERKFHVFGLAFVLFGLGLFTLFQVLPLPEGLLALLSPKAHELRSFVTPDFARASLSYEPGATATAAAALMLAAMVVLTAHERARARRTSYRTIITILAGVIACILVGGIHRIAHLEKMLGLVESSRPAYRLLTTFVNPNHAAGFTAWGAIIALGLALDQKRRHLRTGLGLLALLCSGTSVLCASRGGLITLAVGTLSFILLYSYRHSKTTNSSTKAWLGLMVVLPVTVGVLFRERLAREFIANTEGGLGAEGKLSAIQGAEQLILDHKWFGIGRGAYGSLFSHYKTTPYQFTYTHPENMIVQLVTDWGLLVGGAVLIGIAVLLYSRCKNARSVPEIGAIVGLCALVFQNLMDFSLELLGASLPAAALLGCLSYGKIKAVRIDLTKYRVFIPLLILPIVILSLSVYLAFQQGVLKDDLEKLKTTPSETIAEKHPANAVIAARMAFHAETAKPPEFRSALRWANRALYLAPNYAEAHLLTARLLIKTGHREQGFEEMRRAWELAAPGLLTSYFSQLARLARNTEELMEAIPRRDESNDTVDELALTKLAYWMAVKKQGVRARELLEYLPKVDLIENPEAVLDIAWAAYRTKTSSLAFDALAQRRKLSGNALDGIDLEADVWAAKGRWKEALECIEKGLTSTDPKLKVRRLRRAISFALRLSKFDRVEQHLDQLERSIAPTVNNQIDIVRLKVKFAVAQGKTSEALAHLDDGISATPSDIGLRIQRANLFIRTKRFRNAKNDLDFVLRIEPKHVQALALTKQLGRAQ